MSWQLVPLAQAPRMPWRNGGGSTRELLAWPSAAEWQVRMSVADVQGDGPFSSFPGIARWFAVLEGEGVALSVDGEVHALTARSDPFLFDGGAAVSCTLLDGATRDFNLMAPPGRADLRRVRGSGMVACGKGSLVGVYAHRGHARIDGLAVPEATLAWCRLAAPARVHVEADDALWMEVVE